MGRHIARASLFKFTPTEQSVADLWREEGSKFVSKAAFCRALGIHHSLFSRVLYMAQVLDEIERDKRMIGATSLKRARGGKTLAAQARAKL